MPDTLKVLLLSAWYYPDSSGGTEKYVQLLARDLKSLGAEVVVAAPSTDEQRRTYIYDGTVVHRYPVSLKPSAAEIREEVKPKYFEIFEELIQNVNPNIVHLHSFTRGCSLVYIQYLKSLGIPIVVTVHVPGLNCSRGTMMRWGSIPCDGEMKEYRCAACCLQKRGLPPALACIVAAFPKKFVRFSDRFGGHLATGLSMRWYIQARIKKVRELLSLADRIVVVSNWLYETLKLNQVPISKLVLCRHGVPGDEDSGQETEQSCVLGGIIKVGYIGRFHPVKGVDVLIKAFKKLPDDLSIQLILYGTTNDEEEKSYLRKLHQIAADDRRIFFAGEVTSENRRLVFQNLSAIAVPSVWLESGPFVVLEAFKARLPVLGSDLGGIRELVQHNVNGLIVQPGDTKGWRKVLEKIAQDPLILKRLASGIPPIRSSEEVSREMLELYKEILNN